MKSKKKIMKNDMLEISESVHQIMHDEGYCEYCQMAKEIEKGSALFIGIILIVIFFSVFFYVSAR